MSLKEIELGAVEIELIDVVLAAVVASIIMAVYVFITRKSESHDEEAVKYGGLVGFFLYRLGKRISKTKTFQRVYKDTPHADTQLSKEKIEEIKELWQKESDKWILQAVKDIEQYSPETQAIIKDEAIRRGLD
ncbi:hypothetical protein H8E88_00955 [candidate division KSB1 bacterium]|nr:hypothetical protein [candidate division KSB1 bacterium]